MTLIGKRSVMIMLALGICWSIGCSDKSTGPGKPPAPSGTHIWSKSFPGPSNQFACGSAVDGSGSIIIAGHFYNSVDFGGGTLTSAGGCDIFVAKFSAGGTHLWSKRFGDASSQYVGCVAVDGSGSVIVAGTFDGTVDFGVGVLTDAGGGDAYVAKFGADGTVQWNKRFGNGEFQAATDVAVDVSGNVIVAGRFKGVIQPGDEPLASAGDWDIFIAKFSAGGTHLWSKRFGDASEQRAVKIALDLLGNTIVTGDFRGSFSFGGETLTSAGEGDVFVAKFAADGTHLWSKRFGDASEQFARGIAVDGSGSAVITGDFYGTINFGGAALTCAGIDDIYVAKFGPDGTHIWSNRFGGASDEYPSGIAVDGSGNVIVTGDFFGAVDFGGGALTAAGDADVYVAKFRSDGTHVWSKRFGDASGQYSSDVSVDSSGEVVASGFFLGTVDFGGGVLTSTSDRDIFLAKLSN